MRYALDHMNPNDTFQVVDFGSTSNVLFAQPELATLEMSAARASTSTRSRRTAAR